MPSVRGPAVLCGRAEDVSSLQLLRFIPLHVAARAPHGCSHTGLQLLPARSHTGHKYVLITVTFTVALYLLAENCCHLHAAVFIFNAPYLFLYLVIKKTSFAPERKIWFLFYFSLLLISPTCSSCFPSRSSCGPFGNGETVFNVTGVCVASLPSPAQTALRYLSSEAFALPLILTEV